MVVGLFVAAAGLQGIIGHHASDQNNERDQSLQDNAVNTWQNDRQHIQNEYSQLSSEYNNPAPPAITSPEAFETWSHQEIWNALNGAGQDPGVEQADINAGADGWRKLSDQARAAIDAFRAGMDTAIENSWNGQSGSAALTASQSYATEFETLTVGFQQVANGIDLIQGHLDQAKLSVPPPEDVNVLDEFLGHIPGNGVLKLGKHRANEAEARAQEVMKVYQSGATDVDQQTPILPEPKSPVSNPGSGPDGPGTSVPPGSNVDDPGTGSTGDPSTPTGSDDPAGTEDPSSPGDDSSDDPSSTEDPSSTDDPSTDDPGTDPAGTNPASTVPASNQPSNLTDPSSRPSLGSPGSGSPGSGSPSSPGSTPSPGASIPGGSTSQPTGSGTGNARTGTGTGTGRSGMPGMGMGGGRGSGKDDESEHKIPDYLVQDRTTELLGEQPRVLPPGGVIGG